MGDLKKMLIWFVGIFAAIAAIMVLERRFPTVVVGDTRVSSDTAPLPYKKRTQPARTYTVPPQPYVPFKPRERPLRDVLGSRAYALQMIASLDPAHDDRAGGDTFAPGHGSQYQTPDWNWTVVLELSQPKNIRSMLLLHHRPGEGWSTSSDLIGGKGLYPIVIFYQGRQLNIRYDENLGTYGPGVHTFKLYGQQEITPFNGGQLFVAFSDGTYASAVLRLVPIVNNDAVPDFLSIPVGSADTVVDEKDIDMISNKNPERAGL